MTAAHTPAGWRSRAWWVTGIYAVFAALWIYTSDQILAALVDDPDTLVRLSVYKGWAFVLVTSTLLLALVRRAFGRLEASYQRLEEEEALRQGDEAEIQRLNRLYSAMSRVNSTLSQPGSRNEILERVCRLLVERAGFRLAWVGWHDPESHEIVPVAQHGDGKAGFLADVRVFGDDRPEGGGPSGTAFKSGVPCVVNDLQGDPSSDPWREAVTRWGIRAAAAFPVRIGDDPWGTLTVYAEDGDSFRAEEVDLLAEAATDISLALERIRNAEARLRSEAEVERERELVDRIMESIPGIIYLYDEHGRFVRWNQSFLEVTGYAPDELAGMTPLDFFRGDDVARVSERIGRVFTTGEGQVEAGFVTKDGRAIPYYLTGRRIELRGAPHLVGVGIDISDRIRAEEEALELQRQLQLVVENLREGLVMADPELASLYWNPAALTILGFDDVQEGFRKQRHFGEIFVLHHLDGTPLPPERWPLARTRAGDGFQQLPLLVRRKDNPSFEKIISYSGTRVEYSDGRTLAFVTLRDITAQTRADEALREAKAGLERRVEERTEELRTALERAESADRLKSAFLATMSHELRTPLNSIIGFTGIVLQGLAGPLNEEQNRQLGMVRGSARHLLELINDVLDLSKIEAGQLQVREESVDLREIVERAVGSVTPMAHRKGLEIHTQLPPTPIHLTTDGRRMAQILLNLLNNAVKFTDAGSVTLAVEGGNGQLAIHVTDTGMGIRAVDLRELFQPFRQVDTGLTRQHDGTGLGLAICRRLAELLGGDIQVESTWGQGSTFTLTLPHGKGAAA